MLPFFVNMSSERAHIYYSGMVQGIGFRYAAERFAASFNLAGWVKNLDDGRVEVVCEGSKNDVDNFIERVGDLFKGYIEGTDIKKNPATGEFSGFNIRF